MSKLADELLAIAKGSSGASLKARTHAETVATLRRAAAVLEQKAAEAVERCIENTRSALEYK